MRSLIFKIISIVLVTVFLITGFIMITSADNTYKVITLVASGDELLLDDKKSTLIKKIISNTNNVVQIQLTLKNEGASTTTEEASVLTDTTLVDSFLEDIINNFTFSFVGEPSVGTVSEFNTTDNSFTWYIGTLNNGETATLTYKLILKDTINTNILDKSIYTNNVINMSYTNNKGGPVEILYDCNPSIKVLNTNVNSSTSIDENPPTGTFFNYVVISLILGTSSVTLIYTIKNNKFKNIK